MSNSITTQDSANTHTSRNFVFHLFDGVFIMGGMAFTSVEIVLSVLIYKLGGSEIAIGCVFALTELGAAIPQIFTAPFIPPLRRLKPLVVSIGFIMRLFWLLIALLLFFSDIRDDGKYVLVVLGLISAFFLAAGVIGPGWGDYVATTVPRHLRGRLFALRQGITGIVGIGAGFAVAYILNTFSFPVNFSILFFIAFIFTQFSLVCLALIREPKRPRQPKPDLKDYYFRKIPEIIARDKNFRWFLILKGAMLVSLMSFGFFAVYGVKKFNLSSSAVGTFTSIYMGGQFLSAYFIGHLVDKWGQRLNVILFGVVVILQSILAIFAPNPFVYGTIFLLLGANRTMHSITFISMAMEYGSDGNRPTYYAISFSFLAPLYLSGMFAGWMILYIGYSGVFLCSAFFGIIALGIALFKIIEPRNLDYRASKQLF